MNQRRTSNRQNIGRAHIHSSKKGQRAGPAWRMHVFGVSPHSAESSSHKWFDSCFRLPCFEHKLRSQSLNSPFCHLCLCLRHRLVPRSCPNTLRGRKQPVSCQHPGGEDHQNESCWLRWSRKLHEESLLPLPACSSSWPPSPVTS